MRAGVEPSEATVERKHVQPTESKIIGIDARDFKFAASRRFDGLGHPHNVVGIEVKPHDCIVGLWVRRFFLNRQAFARRVEFRHAVTLRIIDTIAEDRGLLALVHTLHRFGKKLSKT